jgi:hypothetical protein
MVVRIYWNREYETYEALHDDGYIEPLRDGYEAEQLAQKYALEIERRREGCR